LCKNTSETQQNRGQFDSSRILKFESFRILKFSNNTAINNLQSSTPFGHFPISQFNVTQKHQNHFKKSCILSKNASETQQNRGQFDSSRILKFESFRILKLPSKPKSFNHFFLFSKSHQRGVNNQNDICTQYVLPEHYKSQMKMTKKCPQNF